MWDGVVADEPLRVGGVGLGEHGGPLLADGVGVPVVDVGGGVHADPGVAVGVVVPGEEWAAGWNPDRLIFMFQAALLVSYQSCSASFGVRY